MWSSGTLQHALLHLPLARRTTTPLIPGGGGGGGASSANFPESKFFPRGNQILWGAKMGWNPNPNNIKSKSLVLMAKSSSSASKDSSEQQKWSQEGLVTESLPNGMFRIRLDNEDMIIGYISGKIRKSFIRILPGDRVRVEVSRYDSTRGRITYRLRTTKDPS